MQTFDGKCLFVDKLSGDSHANLTPVQLAPCASTDGQGWDIITAGKHNDRANSALFVSTLTNACLNIDRSSTGDQVMLYSCGGRADGGGLVSTSQLFAFIGGPGFLRMGLRLQPNSASGKCLVAEEGFLVVANCNEGDAAQIFTVEGDSTGDGKPSVTNSTQVATSPQGTKTTALTTSTQSTTKTESTQTSQHTNSIPDNNTESGGNENSGHSPQTGVPTLNETGG